MLFVLVVLVVVVVASGLSATRTPTRTKTSWSRELPSGLVSELAARGICEMTGVQAAAWAPVREGRDAVVQSPTATGKTLAYVLPVCARLAPQRKERGRAACPRVIVLAPSRELVTQISGEFRRAAAHFPGIVTAAVYGGCPIDRSIAGLRSKGGADVVAATPGRLADLVGRGDVSLERLETFVFDEADAILDESDRPEVRAIMDELDHDYQLVLFSATITEAVRRFARGTMEVCHDAGFVDADAERALSHSCAPVVASEWFSAAADLLLFERRLSLVFVRSISEAKDLEALLRKRLWHHDVEALHADVDSAARRRVIARLRVPSDRPRTLVATDLAARGIDLPAVDLVLHLGLPRKAGREATVDADLYAHRAGRANREDDSGGGRSVLFYDPSAGEAKLLGSLPSSMERARLPAPDDIVREAASAASQAAAAVPDDVARAFQRHYLNDDDDDDDPLRLPKALAALAGFSPRVSSDPPDLRPRSHLTAKRSDRTLRFDGTDLTRTLVTRACKALGSGKLGQVRLTADNATAFVDVNADRLPTILAALRDHDNHNQHQHLPADATITVLSS